MDATDLERYLHRHIPLSRAMQVAVVALDDDGVHLAAPLAPNINHRDTVFGGSASALAILAAWALVQLRLQAAGIGCRVVIQRNTVDYEAPLEGDFSARSRLAHPQDWPRFRRLLERRGKARIDVAAQLECAGRAGGRFTGTFVALRTDAPAPPSTHDH